MRTRTTRVSQAELNEAALEHATRFQRATVAFLLSKGWRVATVREGPSRRVWAITVTGPSFGVVQPNGLFVVSKGKVSWDWARFDELAEATVPNFNGLPVVLDEEAQA
jgi:hypothetical protein